MSLNFKKNKIIYDYLTLMMSDIDHAVDQYPTPFVWQPISQKKIIDCWHEEVKKNKKQRRYLAMRIHFPFCMSKCSYCCLYSIIANNEKINRFLLAFENEVKVYAPIFKDVEFDSILITGGQPTILDNVRFDKFLKTIFDNFRFRENSHKELDIFPDDLTEEKLALMNKYGINLLSIGIQSFDKNVLRKNARIQDINRFFYFYNNKIKNKWPHNTAIHLIAGLPGQDLKSFLNDLRIILKLKPEIVVLFFFTAFEATRFYKKIYSKKSVNNRDKMKIIAEKIFDRYGYKNKYSNYYLRDDLDSDKKNIIHKYSIQIGDFWDTDNSIKSSLLSLGYASDVSHISEKLWYGNGWIPYFSIYSDVFKNNLFSQTDYERALLGGRLHKQLGFVLNRTERMIEFILKNIRFGFSKEQFINMFNVNFDSAWEKQIKYLSNKKIIINTEKDIKINPKSSYKDFLIYSKCFYSQKALNNFSKNFSIKRLNDRFDADIESEIKDSIFKNKGGIFNNCHHEKE